MSEYELAGLVRQGGEIVIEQFDVRKQTVEGSGRIA